MLDLVFSFCPESGSPIHFRLRADPPRMALDDAPHDHEPHSRSLALLRAVQLLKHAKQFSRITHVESRAVIANKNRLPIGIRGAHRIPSEPRAYFRARRLLLLLLIATTILGLICRVERIASH